MAPREDGGSAIYGYEIEYAKADKNPKYVPYARVKVKPMSTEVKGLPKGTYSFSIEAVNWAGFGPRAETSTTVTIS